MSISLPICVFLFWKADWCYLSLTFQAHFSYHCLSLCSIRNVSVSPCLESVLTYFLVIHCHKTLMQPDWNYIKQMSLSKHAQHLSWQPEKHKWTNSCLLLLLIFTLILPFILFIPTLPLVICLLCSLKKIFFCAGLFCPSLLHRYPSPHLSLSLSLLFDGWSVCWRIFWLS